MAIELEYSSAIKEFPLLFLETRRTAQLLCDGQNDDEIIELSVKNNIFQLEKERRRKDLPKKILKRLSSLDKNLIEVIANGRDENAKLIAMLAIIKTDRLFFEFMRDVYADKFISGQMEISDKDFITFLNCKIHESEKVAKWKQDNLEKIRSTYKKILYDAGLAKKNCNEIQIIQPICDKEIMELLKGNDNGIYANAMLLGV